MLVRFGEALQRGILGKANPMHLSEMTGSDEYEERAIAAQLGWPAREPGPPSGGDPRA
jgi:hypothetical protein